MKAMTKIAATVAAASMLVGGGAAAFADDATLADLDLTVGEGTLGSTVNESEIPEAGELAVDVPETTAEDAAPEATEEGSTEEGFDFGREDVKGLVGYNTNGGVNTFPRPAAPTEGSSWADTDKPAGSELTADPKWTPGLHISTLPNINECVEVSDAELAAFGLAGAENSDIKCQFSASGNAVYLDASGLPVKVELASAEVAALQAQAAGNAGAPAADKGDKAATDADKAADKAKGADKAKDAKVAPAKAAAKATAASGLANTGASLPMAAGLVALVAGAGAVAASRRMK